MCRVIGQGTGRLLQQVRSSSWLQSSSAPFLWLALTPLVTVPLSAVLYVYNAVPYPGEDSSEACQEWHGYSEFDAFPFFPFYECGSHPEGATLLAFALPGLLNLVPLCWAVLSPERTARIAGAVAGVLGIVRMAFPAVFLSTAIETGATGGGGFRYYRVFLGEGYFHGVAEPIYIMGGLVWLGGLLAWLLFALLVEHGLLEDGSEHERLPPLPPRTRSD